jgi:hypothetical protein
MDDEWVAIQRSSGRAVAWPSCTCRNLLAHRGTIHHDATGFARGVIDRPLLVVLHRHNAVANAAASRPFEHAR